MVRDFIFSSELPFMPPGPGLPSPLSLAHAARTRGACLRAPGTGLDGAVTIAFPEGDGRCQTNPMVIWGISGRGPSLNAPRGLNRFGCRTKPIHPAWALIFEAGFVWKARLPGLASGI